MFSILPFNFRSNAEKGKESVERFMDYVMEQPLNPINKVSGAFSSFRVDVKECEDSYIVFAELPGFEKEDITLAYEGNKYLVISTRQGEEEQDTDGRYICRERRVGKFERSFYIDNISEEEITAEFKNGILVVTLPKYKPEVPKKIIDIK